MSNNGYSANLGWLLTSAIGLVLPSFGAVSPAMVSPPASASPSGSVTSSPTASSASFRRLRAAFWLRSCCVPQLGHSHSRARPRSRFTTPQPEQVLLLGYHWSASTMRVPYQLALYWIWSSRRDIPASANALACSPALIMPATFRVSMPRVWYLRTNSRLTWWCALSRKPLVRRWAWSMRR